MTDFQTAFDTFFAKAQAAVERRLQAYGQQSSAAPKLSAMHASRLSFNASCPESPSSRAAWAFVDQTRRRCTPMRRLESAGPGGARGSISGRR